MSDEVRREPNDSCAVSISTMRIAEIQRQLEVACLIWPDQGQAAVAMTKSERARALSSSSLTKQSKSSAREARSDLSSKSAPRESFTGPVGAKRARQCRAARLHVALLALGEDWPSSAAGQVSHLIEKHRSLVSIQAGHVGQQFGQKWVSQRSIDGFLPAAAGILKQLTDVCVKRTSQSLERRECRDRFAILNF